MKPTPEELREQSQVLRFREIGMRWMMEQMKLIKKIPRGGEKWKLVKGSVQYLNLVHGCPERIAFLAVQKIVNLAWSRTQRQKKGLSNEGKLQKLRTAGKQLLAASMRRAPTEAEKTLFDALQKFNADFKLQAVVSGYIADIYSPLMLLAFEADGGYHLDRAQYDRQRDENIAKLGVLTLRFTNDRIAHDLSGILREVTPVILSRAKRALENKQLWNGKHRRILRSVVRCCEKRV